jgi:hypothetical protein
LKNTRHQIDFGRKRLTTSIEPYRIEDALRDPNWVVAMQEELNNFTRNEIGMKTRWIQPDTGPSCILP